MRCKSAPNPVLFSGRNGMLQARIHDVTEATDLLGPFLADPKCPTSFVIPRIEQINRVIAASGIAPPLPDLLTVGVGLVDPRFRRQITALRWLASICLRPDAISAWLQPQSRRESHPSLANSFSTHQQLDQPQTAPDDNGGVCGGDDVDHTIGDAGSCMVRAIAKAASGVSAAGLTTTVHPAARAGATLRMIIAAGSSTPDQSDSRESNAALSL